jgi:hypothetical protein
MNVGIKRPSVVPVLFNTLPEFRDTRFEFFVLKIRDEKQECHHRRSDDVFIINTKLLEHTRTTRDHVNKQWGHDRE